MNVFRSPSRRLFLSLLFAPVLWPLAVLVYAKFSTPLIVAAPALPVQVPAETHTPYVHHEEIFQPVPEFVRFHAASLALAQNGDLLAVCRGDRPGSSRSSWGLSATILFTRKPRGQTQWAAPVAIHVTPDRMDTNPVLWSDPGCGGPDGKGGRVWLFHGTSFGVGWQFSRIFFCYSDDFGRTWSPSKPINGIENLNTRCPPVSVPLPSGKRQIVLPVYCEYGQSLCLISRDDGQTWESSERMVSGIVGNFQPSLVVRPNGNLAAFMRASGLKRILYTESSDGGWHWRPIEALQLTNPFTSVAAAEFGPDRVVLAYNNTDAVERRHLTLTISPASSNPGCFAAGREIVPAEFQDQQQEYPAVLTTRDGRILVAYTLGRNRIQLFECNRAWLETAPTTPLAAGEQLPWRGLPGLVALLLYAAMAGILRWVVARWQRQTPSGSVSTNASAYAAVVFSGEALLLLLLFFLGPHGIGFGDHLILGVDDFLSAMQALTAVTWFGLIAALLLGLVCLRAPALAVCGWTALLAGPLLLGTIAGGLLMWPPQDPAFGLVTIDNPWSTPGTPLPTDRLASLRAEYQRDYRAREAAAMAAATSATDAIDPAVDRFTQSRGELDANFATANGLTAAQVAALSPYWTGERFVEAPPLQDNRALMLRSLGGLLGAWLLGATLLLIRRRRLSHADSAPSALPPPAAPPAAPPGA